MNEPWYSLIEKKKKTMEARLNKFGIEKLKKGDVMEIINKNDRKKSLLVIVKDRKHYESIELYLKDCLKQALPINFMTIEKGIETYRQYISEQTENEMGIEALAIEVFEN